MSEGGVGMSEGGVGVSEGGVGMSEGRGVHVQGVVCIPPVRGTWDTHPLVLTPSGGHHNMYGWQAGGMHPLLECFRVANMRFPILLCNVRSNYIFAKICFELCPSMFFRALLRQHR